MSAVPYMTGRERACHLVDAPMGAIFWHNLGGGATGATMKVVSRFGDNVWCEIIEENNELQGRVYEFTIHARIYLHLEAKR